jgi:subtilase family serine protease
MTGTKTARRVQGLLPGVVLILALILLLPVLTSTQTTAPRSLLTQAVDDSKLIRLRGNTHPWARPEFDQGPAPPDLPMDRMLLDLRRSPEQEAALHRLMEEQQDRSSPNFHHWLSPAQFGDQFGPSDGEIQTVTSWLESQGFQAAQVSKGHMAIEFTGTASNIKQALHTEIHKYFVNGEEHWANSSDPQIPAALAPVVAGVNTLHNFRLRPATRLAGAFTWSKTTGEARPRHPDFTLPDPTPCGQIIVSGYCFTLGPADFATIYNVLPLWAEGIDGTGQTIAIVGDSNINIQNAHQFRSMFGLPVNDPQVILAGTDPGVNVDEFEADADTQWTGAVATGATIDLVIAANTNSSLGADTAANFIVNTMTPTPQILSDAFDTCESMLGATRNIFYNNLWQQAAAEGISVSITIGDNGSANCENPNPSLTTAQPATTGLAVNGLGSTPFNVAVGGTDFDQYPNPLPFWNTTNNPSTLASAKGYIPETTWNNSCTSSIWILIGFSTDALTNCNSTAASFQMNIVPVGGSGGHSSCAIFDGMSCSGYPKPAWQTALTPKDGARDVPDVSFFANVSFGSFYILCQIDIDGNEPCTLGNFSGSGGTSITAQVFAGILALLDQKKGGPQGLINPRLYQLAAEPGASCVSTANPAATCIFYDVVKGTNAQPCVKGSPDCSEADTAIALPPLRRLSRAGVIFVALACISFFAILLLGLKLKDRKWSSVFALLVFALFLSCAACSGGSGGGGGSGPPVGILAGYNAVPGYDRATGLGSVNVTNFVDNW